MNKRNPLAPPRGGVIIHMTMKQARKVLKALNGPSVTDIDIAAFYDLLNETLNPTEESTP